MERATSNGASSGTTTKATRALLACGVAAGPVHVIVGAIEAFIREGFDPTRHDLSLLANGEWGWFHITLLVLTALLSVAGAVGMRRVLRGGRGSTWGPLLIGVYGIGVYGLGLIGAGVFHGRCRTGSPSGSFGGGTVKCSTPSGPWVTTSRC